MELMLIKPDLMMLDHINAARDDNPYEYYLQIYLTNKKIHT